MTNHRDRTLRADREATSRTRRREPGRGTNGRRVPPPDLTSELLGGDPNTVDETLGRGFGNPFRGAAQAGSGRPPSDGPDSEHLSRIAPLAYQHRTPVFTGLADVRNWLLAVADLVVAEVDRRTSPGDPARTTAQPPPDPHRPSRCLLVLLGQVWEIVAWLHDGAYPPVDVPTSLDFDVAPVVARLAVPAHGSTHSASRRFFDRADRMIGALLVARTGNPRCPELEQMRQRWDGSFDPVFRDSVVAHVDKCATCNERRRTMLLSSFGSRSRLGLAGASTPVPGTAAVLGVVHGHEPPGNDRPPKTDTPHRRKHRDPGRQAARVPGVPSRGTSGRATLPPLVAVPVLIIILLVLVVSLPHAAPGWDESWLGGGSGAGTAAPPAASSPTDPPSGSVSDPPPSGSVSDPPPTGSSPQPALRLSAYAVNLGFTATSGSVTLFNDGGSPSAVTVDKEEDKTWLQVPRPTDEIQPRGSVPLTVTVDRASAPPGAFEATISIKPVADGDGVDLFVVGNGAKPPAAFRLSDTTVDLGATGTEASVTVYNDGGRPSGVVVDGDEAGLVVTPPAGQVPPGASATLTVAVKQDQAPAGPFTRRLHVDPAAGGAGAELSVAVGGEASPAAFRLSDTTVDLGATGTDASVTVYNDGGRPSEVVVDGDETGLVVTPPPGQIPPGANATLTVAVKPPAGPFTRRLHVHPAAGGAGAELSVAVGGEAPPAAFRLSDTTVDLGATGTDASVTVYNDGERPSEVVVDGDETGLVVTPPAGQIPPGANATLTVEIDRIDVPHEGTFDYQLNVTPSDGGVGATLVVVGSVDPPTANLTVTTLAPFEVHAEASASTPGSAPIATYHIDWGDGTSDSLDAPDTGRDHTYTAVGTYTVSMTVTDENYRVSTSSRAVTQAGHAGVWDGGSGEQQMIH